MSHFIGYLCWTCSTVVYHHVTWNIDDFLRATGSQVSNDQNPPWWFKKRMGIWLKYRGLGIYERRSWRIQPCFWRGKKLHTSELGSLFSIAVPSDVSDLGWIEFSGFSGVNCTIKIHKSKLWPLLLAGFPFVCNHMSLQQRDGSLKNVSC